MEAEINAKKANIFPIIPAGSIYSLQNQQVPDFDIQK